MSNVTLAIDDALLKEARIKALKEGTSVNEICRRAIEQYVGRGEDDAERRVARLRASFAQALPRPPGSPPAWQGREAVYEERMQELERRRRK
jgi:Ribbon-helix-helix protein, copG family